MDSLLKYLPGHYKLPDDKNYNLPAIISALDEAFYHFDTFLSESQKQLYFSTATGQYLIQLAASKGFSLERGSGINIDGFEKIAPIVALSPKQAYSTLASLLEAFYAPEFVRANTLSVQPGAYILLPNDTLTIKIGDEIVTATFISDAFPDFQNIPTSTLASYLNALQLGFLASSFRDRSTNLQNLRLLSNTVSAASSIQVIGGTAASIFKFAHYHEPVHEVGTQLLFTKPAYHSDIVTCTWDGVLTNPLFHRLAIGDFVSFRNLFDVETSGSISVPNTDEWGYVDGTYTTRTLTAGNYSVLNGWHQVTDVGYDFFKFKIEGFFPELNSGNIYLRSVRDLHLQINQAVRLYDQIEYALLSETLPNTITAVVPAVPPIVKRYLEGAWHIHGAIGNVLSITRNSITMSMQSVDFPDECAFSVYSSKNAVQIDKKWYRTATRTLDTWILSSDSALFPYTSPELINDNTLYPFNGKLDSDIVTITSKNDHELLPGYSVTIASADDNEGFSLNGTFPVVNIINKNTFNIRTNTILSGITTTQRVAIVRLPYTRPDGANAYIQFASNVDLIASGIVDGTRVKLVIDSSSIIDDGAATFRLLQGYMGIISTDNDKLYISASITPGSGNVVHNTPLRRAICSWGGSPTYFFDTTYAKNAEYFQGMKAVLTDYVPIQNPLFVGSYAYDTQVKFSLSRLGANITSVITSGDSDAVLTLNDDAAELPQTGYIIIAHGTSEAEGPIRYTAVYQENSNYKMKLDPTYVVQNTHAIGVRVWHVAKLEAPSLDIYGKHYQPYLTGTSAARQKLFDIMRSMVAAGVFVEESTIYPDLKFEDEQIKVFE